MSGMMAMMANVQRNMYAGGAAFSASLNGTSQYLSVSNAAFTFAGNFTVEGWFRPTISLNGTLFTIGISTFDADAYVLASVSGVLVGQKSGGGPRSFRNASNILSYNTWSHVALVRSGSTITAYVDGTAAASTDTQSGTIGNGGLVIGFPVNNDGYFRGNISNFRVSNSAVYTSNFTPATSPLTINANTVALLPLTTTPFVDISTNAFTVTNFGTTSVSLQNPFY
jgi:hypothetical protein